MPQPRVSHKEVFYKKVAGSTLDESPGVVIPNNQWIALLSFRANGADPTAYVYLIWDRGGAAEKVIAATRGDIKLEFNTTNSDILFQGDNVKKLSIVIENDNATQSPFIGGAWEATNVNAPG